MAVVARPLTDDQVTTVLACLTNKKLPGVELTLRFFDHPTSLEAVRKVADFCALGLMNVAPEVKKSLDKMVSSGKIVPHLDIPLRLGTNVTHVHIARWQTSIFRAATKLYVS